MAYKNDHLLTIADKYGKASNDAKAELFETWDRLRDLTVSGPTLGTTGFGPTASFFMNMARLVAPSAFMPVLGSNAITIPGTSYFSPISGGNSILPGGQSAFGFNQMGNYLGFPTGYAANLNSSSGNIAAIGAMGLPLLFGIGSSLFSSNDGISISGSPTGGAASVAGATNLAGAIGGISSGYGVGGNYLLPTAGIISGVGGLMTALGPYFGPFGLAAGIAGRLAQGYGGAMLNTYQRTTGKILNNADVVLSNKIKNIETVVKQLDTQGDVIRKMLKEMVEADSKALQNL